MGIPHLGPTRSAATIIEICGKHLELKVDQRFEKAGFDMRAHSFNAAANKRGQYPLSQDMAGKHVRDREPKGDRSIVGATIQPHGPRQGLGQQILPRQTGPWTTCSVARYGANDEARVTRSQKLWADAKTVGHPRSKILDYDISPIDEAIEEIAISRRRIVKRDALLVPVDGMEQGRITSYIGVGQIQAAANVPDAGTLYLYDSRAKIAQT